MTKAAQVSRTPLVSVEIQELWLDFHVFMDDRWVRFGSTNNNISLPLAIDFTANNELVPLSGELSQALRDLRVENTDLLRGDSSLGSYATSDAHQCFCQRFGHRFG